MFSWAMTRGDVLRYGVTFALRRARKVVRGLKEALTEEERYAVADHVVASSRSTASFGACPKRRDRKAADHRRARGADSEE